MKIYVTHEDWDGKPLDRLNIDGERAWLLVPPHGSYGLHVAGIFDGQIPIGMKDWSLYMIQPSLRGRMRGFWFIVKLGAWLAFKGRPYEGSYP